MLCIISNIIAESIIKGHVWDYEHIGRRVAVHIVVEVGHIEAVVAVPTDFVDMAAVHIAAGRIAGRGVVGSIDFGVLDLDTET